MRSNLRSIGAAVLIVVATAAILRGTRAQQQDVNMQCALSEIRLGTATMEYVQDYDEKFPPMAPSGTFRRLVMPYLRGTFPYCPATYMPYSPNTKLSYASLAQFPFQDSVPLAQDAKAHRDGKLNVVFLDMHVEHGGVEIDPFNPTDECVNNVHAMTLATLMYVQDYDEHLPPITSSQQYEDIIRPYTKLSHHHDKCPATQAPYAPNAALSYTALQDWPFPAATIVVHDGKPHADGKSTFGYLDDHVVRK